MPQLSFHPGYHGGALLLVALGAAGLVALFYRRALRSVPLGRWAGLYLLRMFAIGIVLLLLFRPVLSFPRQITERRTVLFLLDNSPSMSIADEAASGTRLEHARSQVGAWSRQLADNFAIEVRTFADEVQAVRADDLPGVTPAGKGTSLVQALQAAAHEAKRTPLEAIVLVSDGVHNAAGSPNKVAASVGAPVHTVGVGSVLRERGSYRDIRVVDLECPPQLAVHNKARLRASVDAVGFPGRVVTVALLEDQQQVAEKSLALDDVEGAQFVDLEFIPDAKGLHQYTVRAARVPDERIVENNERSRTALVVDSRIRVLYVEGTLRSEYGALVGRFLAKDPNVEFCALVQTRPNVFLTRSNVTDIDLKAIPTTAEEFDHFDVFVLGDLDRSYFRDEQLTLLRERIERGAGLIALGGYHSLGPGGYAGSPLEPLLPLQLGDREIGQLGEPFLPQLTIEGRQHPIFAGIQSFFPSETAPAELDGLPSLEGCVRVAGVRPSATVLAHHPTERLNDRPLPTLADQPAGKGRTAIFTADTTRNWQQSLRSLDRESPFLRFWGQTVRWLASRSDTVSGEAGITATIDNAYYEPEQSVTISAIVRGNEGAAAEHAHVTAHIRQPNGQSRELPLLAVPGPAGNFRLTWEPDQVGRFDLEIQAQIDGQSLKSAPLVFDVGRPSLEFDRLDLDDKQLAAIAHLTGGQYQHLSTADRLIQGFERRLERRRVDYELAVAWPPLMWLLFASVLTVEWLFRRSQALR